MKPCRVALVGELDCHSSFNGWAPCGAPPPDVHGRLGPHRGETVNRSGAATVAARAQPASTAVPTGDHRAGGWREAVARQTGLVLPRWLTADVLRTSPRTAPGRPDLRGRAGLLRRRPGARLRRVRDHLRRAEHHRRPDPATSTTGTRSLRCSPSCPPPASGRDVIVAVFNGNVELARLDAAIVGSAVAVVHITVWGMACSLSIWLLVWCSRGSGAPPSDGAYRGHPMCLGTLWRRCDQTA